MDPVKDPFKEPFKDPFEAPFKKTAQVEENVTPCEVCGRPSTTITDGMPRCSLHIGNLGADTQTQNIKKAEAQLTQ